MLLAKQKADESQKLDLSRHYFSLETPRWRHYFLLCMSLLAVTPKK